MKALLISLFVMLLLFTACSPDSSYRTPTPESSISLVPLYVGGFKLAMIPSDAIVDLKDDTVGQRLTQLAQSGRLFVFYGEASTPTPFPEEGYKAARTEAFVKISQFVELRVKSIEWKISSTISQTGTPKSLKALTESIIKRAIQISTDVNFSGARDIVRYRLDRPGELDRYVVVVLFDPEVLLASLKGSMEYLKLRNTAEQMGENGKIFFEQLNEVLEEAFKAF